MTPKDFIEKELDVFIGRFPQVRVRYEFRELSNAHFIEIVPNEVYNLDEDYISWELDMYDKFSELYPYEGICFISDDALVGIENSEYFKEGINYAEFSNGLQKNIIIDTVDITSDSCIDTIDITSVLCKTFPVDIVESINTIQISQEFLSPIYNQSFLLAA